MDIVAARGQNVRLRKVLGGRDVDGEDAFIAGIRRLIELAASTCNQAQRETPSAYCQGRLKRGGRDSSCCPACRAIEHGDPAARKACQVPAFRRDHRLAQKQAKEAAKRLAVLSLARRTGLELLPGLPGN